uniref:Uncharacterized protein n=1 Tax=Micrurus corallinus TaxID=54390 RepID=A0A2D4FDC4_MICCO
MTFLLLSETVSCASFQNPRKKSLDSIKTEKSTFTGFEVIATKGKQDLRQIGAEITPLKVIPSSLPQESRLDIQSEVCIMSCGVYLQVVSHSSGMSRPWRRAAEQAPRSLFLHLPV